jgi:hypothetical protein
LKTQTELLGVRSLLEQEKTQAPDSTYQREQQRIVGQGELYWAEDIGGRMLEMR